jgi:peroxiredoxin Q/BCP
MWKALRYVAKKALGRMPGLLPVGTPAPDFRVRDHAGAEVTRAGLLGTRYVLWFYPKAGTPG